MISNIFNKEYLKRLDNIKQWQEIDTFIKESVSQHSYKVVVFCRVLLEDVFGYTEDETILRFKLDCLTRSILHDWDEALILRDLSHATKYNTFNGPEIRKAVDDLSDHLAHEDFEQRDDNGELTDVANMMLDNILSPADGVKQFCKVCDWLALLFFVIRERNLGNVNLNNSFDIAVRGMKTSWEVTKEYLERRFVGYKLDFSEIETLINNQCKYECK